MPLIVVTGPVRSGKSRIAEKLASSSGKRVVVIAAGRPVDREMQDRIERHRAGRPRTFLTLEPTDALGWFNAVRDDDCVLVECLGTLVAALMEDLQFSEDEKAVASTDRLEADAERLVRWLAGREGDTVVVTNEVGWGVVPTSAAGRAFRDALGRANASLVGSAASAWLVVAGRCVPLHGMPTTIGWPGRDGDIG